jgi:hypothetical protein
VGAFNAYDVTTMDLDSLLSDLESSSTVVEANNALAVIIRDLGFDSGTYIDANPAIRDSAGTVARYYFIRFPRDCFDHESSTHALFGQL